MRSSRDIGRVAAALLLCVAAAVSPPLRSRAESGGPPAVVSVSVEGHETMSAREISLIVNPDPRAPFDEAVLTGRADSLLCELALHGRPFATVGVEWTVEPEGVALHVRVDEGPDARLSSLHIVGGESLGPETALRQFEIAPGDPVTARALESGIEELLSLYGDSGRPFAEVRVAGVSLDAEGAVEVRLEVAEGPHTYFDSLDVAGNRVTRSYVIARESGLEPGEPYSARKLKRVRPRLERLGLFASVSEPAVSVDPSTGAATVAVEVSERRTSRVSGALGYVPPVDSRDGEFTGRFDVELRNIAGTGRSAAAVWERITSERSRIEFSYREPWLLGAPIDVGVRGVQTVNDTIYTTTEGDLLVTARAGDRTRITWTMGAERYVPGGPDESATTSYRTSLSAERDGTDVPGNPSRGTVIRGSLEYAAKKEADGGESHRSGTAEAEMRAFIPVTRGQVIAVGALASGIASTEDDVPFHEQLTLGGARSLRGYREEQFRGTRTALATLEYRFLLTRTSRALAFVDLGYYFRAGSNPAKDTKLGYGIGLRAENRLGIIAVDYGLGEGDRPLDGKLHVGLVREF